MAANGCRILVVDDDDESRGLLIDLLHHEGYSVVGAENGALAVASLEDGFDPDLILTDLMMPAMSGWELCQVLRDTPDWRSIPVVVLCGMSADQRGKLQVEHAFEKPTDMKQLLSRISELCGI